MVIDMPRKPRIMMNDSRITGGKGFIYTPLQFFKKPGKWLYANMMSVKKKDTVYSFSRRGNK
jgi:hypothetical protein